MPASSQSTRSSKKTAKKVASKAAKKSATKTAKKATRKTAKKTAKKTARKTVRSQQDSEPRPAKVSAGVRREMIETAAYYLAEKRNFQGGDPVADWLICEKEIDTLLSSKNT